MVLKEQNGNEKWENLFLKCLRKVLKWFSGHQLNYGYHFVLLLLYFEQHWLFFFFFLRAISRFFPHICRQLTVGSRRMKSLSRLQNQTVCSQLLTQNWSDLIWFLSLKEPGSHPLGLDSYTWLEANGICKSVLAFVLTCLERRSVAFPHNTSSQMTERYL